MFRFTTILSSLVLLLSASVFAGGSIFGGGSGKASNPQGVFSIGVHICGTLNCPNVILKQGDCGEESHTRMQYGVCVCEEGYQVEDDHCVAKDGKKDTPWEPSPCATDDDCAEDEQCLDRMCWKIQTEEVSCSSDEMLVDINGDGSVMGCIPCLANGPLLNALVTDCAETCPNREVIEEACALKECPAGYAMDETYRQCYPCDDSEAWWDEDTDKVTTACNQCSNREMMDVDGDDVCALKTCPSGYSRGELGSCFFDCSGYPGSSEFGTGGAVPDNPGCKCPEKSIWDSAAASCICETGYRESRDGACLYNCSYWYPGSYMIPFAIGGYTPNKDCRCVSAEADWDDASYRCQCKGYGNRIIMDITGDCRACDYAGSFIPLVESECVSKCPNRTLIDDECVLN